jgi:hypothetical protein
MIPDPLAMIPMPTRSRERSSAVASEAGPLLGPAAWDWRDAQADATLAHAAWCSRPGADAYAAYRAAQDRADAAQDALARAVTQARRR